MDPYKKYNGMRYGIVIYFMLLNDWHIHMPWYLQGMCKEYHEITMVHIQ